MNETTNPRHLALANTGNIFKEILEYTFCDIENLGFVV